MKETVRVGVHKWENGGVCVFCKAERIKVKGEFMYTYVSPDTLINYYRVRTKPKCVREMKQYNLESGRNL